MGEKIFEDMNARLKKEGLMMNGGTIADATIIAVPCSTKNKEGKRDPEMHQTKKGEQWHFGMKAHIGADAGNGYVHTAVATAANVHDITMTHELIREDNKVLYGDSGHLGIEKREEIKNDEHFKGAEFKINRPASRHPCGGIAQRSFKRHGAILNQVAPKDGRLLVAEKDEDHRKSSVRCKVEHIFLIIKRDFGYAKARYRGKA